MEESDKEDLAHFLHMLAISEARYLNWAEVRKKAKIFKKTLESNKYEKEKKEMGFNISSRKDGNH